jgi:hypothetical protein
MKNLFTRFARDDSAAMAIEYGLIAAGISVAMYRHQPECQLPYGFGPAEIVERQR